MVTSNAIISYMAVVRPWACTGGPAGQLPFLGTFKAIFIPKTPVFQANSILGYFQESGLLKHSFINVRTFFRAAPLFKKSCTPPESCGYDFEGQN